MSEDSGVSAEMEQAEPQAQVQMTPQALPVQIDLAYFANMEQKIYQERLQNEAAFKQFCDNNERGLNVIRLAKIGWLASQGSNDQGA